jgi:hypothetical protein
LLIFSTTIKANDVVYIQKDQKAPFSGILFSESKAKEIRSDLLEADKVKLQLQSSEFKYSNMQRIVELKDEEIKLYQVQNERLIQASNTNEISNYVWFGLGVLATGLSVFAAGSLAK